MHYLLVEGKRRDVYVEGGKWRSIKTLSDHSQELLELTIYSFHNYDSLRVCYLQSRKMETSKTELWPRSSIHP